MPLRNSVPVARIRLGPGAGCVIDVHGYPASEFGIPLVEISGGLGYVEHLTVEQAEALAAGLTLAARVARGEVLPTALDAFLEKRQA